MNSWTRRLARSLFRIAGKPVPGQADSAPDSRALAARAEADAALMRACGELIARQARDRRDLAAVPDGAWIQFAETLTANDGALREGVAQLADLRAQSGDGLRAKAEAMKMLLDGATDDPELACRIARSLIEDALSVLPAGAGAAG